MDIEQIQQHLIKLASQAPPAKPNTSAREMVRKYFGQIEHLIDMGWQWDDIAQGFVGKKGPLKGATIRTYFYERRRILQELKQIREDEEEEEVVQCPGKLPRRELMAGEVYITARWLEACWLTEHPDE